MKYTTYNVQQLTNRKGKPWQARAKYKDVNGKWREVSKMLPEAKGKKEASRIAKEWFDTLNAEADLMPNIAKVKTIDDVVVDYLNHQLATGEIERSTHANQMSNYKKYIKPQLGDYIFTEIDKTIISSWLTGLYQEGYSQNTIHGIFTILRKVYNYFYENGELLKNPFKGVKVPKKGSPRVTHLTDEQMDKVLTAVYSDYEPEDGMFAGILLAFYGGLRRGEICGLRWNDIDFQKHTITIRSAVGVAGGRNYTKGPKNRTSNRTFPMVPQLEEALALRKEKISPKDNWYVAGKKDKHMNPSWFNMYFSEFAKRNSLMDAYGKKVIPHGLRHNFATVGIRANMDIASLSLMMGHGSRAMTLDTYGDANADALNTASIKLKEKFNESSEAYFSQDEYEAWEDEKFDF